MLNPLTQQLTSCGLAVALYASGSAAPSLEAVRRGVDALGGVERARELGAVWADLNRQLLAGLTSDTDYERRIRERWPDPALLRRCNSAAFDLLLSA